MRTAITRLTLAVATLAVSATIAAAPVMAAKEQAKPAQTKHSMQIKHPMVKHQRSASLQTREARLFDFLDSGQSLTVSAAGKAYVLPPIRIAGWKTRFQKIC